MTHCSRCLVVVIIINTDAIIIIVAGKMSENLAGENVGGEFSLVATELFGGMDFMMSFNYSVFMYFAWMGTSLLFDGCQPFLVCFICSGFGIGLLFEKHETFFNQNHFILQNAFIV